MKADYKNWVPKGMVFSVSVAAFSLLVLSFLFCFSGILRGAARTVLSSVAVAAFLFFLLLLIKINAMYNAFSYSGKRQLSRRIVEGVSEYVLIPDGGTCLDVGCGSGALAIACAKRNPKAQILGIDRWGKEYASFSKTLCEKNAEAEQVSNVKFQNGDARSLDFDDETFDAVTSNYVYHNIADCADKKTLLRETFRVLKKGGVFALHDLMCAARYGYGDMNAFKDELLKEGFSKVELIDTADGMFMSSKEAKSFALAGSALLVGTK